MDTPITLGPAWAWQLPDGRWRYTVHEAMAEPGAVVVQRIASEGQIILHRQLAQAGEYIRGAEQVG